MVYFSFKNTPNPSLSNPSLFLLAVAVGGACFFGIKIWLSILNGDDLNHVAGTWTALALDLKNGIFYRPLFSETTGYGGTRYFPLFFSLHALIIQLTDKPIFSGHILSISAGLMLIGASYLFMRQMELEIPVALHYPSSCSHPVAFNLVFKAYGVMFYHSL